MGADLIKIFASKSQRIGAGPTFSEEQLRVLCDEAKAVGLRSMVHAYRSQTGAAARRSSSRPTRRRARMAAVRRVVFVMRGGVVYKSAGAKAK